MSEAGKAADGREPILGDSDALPTSGKAPGGREPADPKAGERRAEPKQAGERDAARRLAEFRAYHDQLTRLPNRALLLDRLELAIAQAQRNRRKLALMFLDLDGFKPVNDQLGHLLGDKLLQEVAGRLQSCVRRSDTLSRFGGDEFALLLPEVRSPDDMAALAGKLLDSLGQPFIIDDRELSLSASIGLALYPEAGESAETLIRHADLAMYEAKRQGKNGFCFYSEALRQKRSSRSATGREQQDALLRGQIELRYLPQVSLASGEILGVQAAPHWPGAARGPMEAEHLLATADESGFGIQLREQTHRQACRQVGEWRRAGWERLRLSLPLSPAQLQRTAFAADFAAMLQGAQLAPSALRVQIGEAALLEEAQALAAQLKQLRSQGMRVAIADFGAGYCSPRQLARFPADELQLDGALAAAADADGRRALNAAAALARELGLDLSAAAVESPAQLLRLQRCGCREAQGPLFSPALPPARLAELLRRNPFPTLIPA